MEKHLQQLKEPDVFVTGDSVPQTCSHPLLEMVEGFYLEVSQLSVSSPGSTVVSG